MTVDVSDQNLDRAWHGTSAVFPIPESILGDAKDFGCLFLCPAVPLPPSTDLDRIAVVRLCCQDGLPDQLGDLRDYTVSDGSQSVHDTG